MQPSDITFTALLISLGVVVAISIYAVVKKIKLDRKNHGALFYTAISAAVAGLVFAALYVNQITT